MRKLLCLLLVLGGCASASGQEVAPEVSRSAPRDVTLRVETARLVESDARLPWSIPAEVRAARDAQLGAALGGFVESVRVEVGDVVKKGQVLALIDAALHAAQREQAAAQLERAEQELRRATQLAGVIPEAELDRAKSAARLAKAGLDAVTASGRRATIRAPFDGTVSAVSIEPGEIVAPGSPVIELLALDRVRVIADISERQLDRVAVGGAVEVWALGAKREATIERISPAADAQSHGFEIEASLDNSERSLAPGMLVKLAPTDARELGATLAVPQGALLGHGAGLCVFVVEDGHARLRPVTLGPITEGYALVERGLRAGEQVVTRGHRELLDGDAVTVVASADCCRVARTRLAVQP